MTAFNVVRFRVKPGYVEKFVEAHRRMRPAFKGFLEGHLVKTGDETFCFVGQWRTFRSIETARPQMIALLDGFRDMLQDMGGGLGLTDPVSGVAVAKMAVPKAAKKSAAKKAPKKVAKKVAKKANPGARKTAKKADSKR
jgi:hypothetical protein